MDIIRLQILENSIGLPNYQGFKAKFGSEIAELADTMFKALWHNYLKDKGSINLTHWADKFNNPKAFNIILMSLSKAGWIISHSIPNRNWAEAELNEDKLLNYVTSDELESIRAHKKYTQYVQTLKVSNKSTLTRVNGKTKDTGLVREGFAKSGNTEYKYNQHYMEEYASIIQQNLTKGMDKVAELHPNLRHDRASYDKISTDILEYHLTTNDSFSSGNRKQDSRGRNIQGVTSTVAGYVGCKDFRALLEIQ